MGDHHFVPDESEDSLGAHNGMDPIRAKICYFYKDEDYKFSPVKVAVHPKYHRSFNVLLAEISSKMKGLNYGVRTVVTPRGRHSVRQLDALEDGGQYVCSSRRKYLRALDVEKVAAPELWHLAKPKSGVRELNAMLAEFEIEEVPRRRRRLRIGYGGGSNKSPKKVTIMRNGDPSLCHILLLNRKTAQSFEQVMSDISEMFRFAVHKLYTIEGRRVTNLTQLLNGPEELVAGGKENFKSMLRFMYRSPKPPTNAVRPRLRSRNPTRDTIGSRIRDRRDRLMRTKGRWKVWISTNELANAGTQAQVTVTVYGHKANSGPIPLGYADGNGFQSGQIDEFDVSVGSIGEIYKIRIAHDNTGDCPGWLCDEIRMKDVDSGEELVFPCKRWLARDEDDHETCRELPVVRRGDPTLPVIKYNVQVTTGNLWNAGTDANVYLTIYGDRGDTGVRQLYADSRQKTFKQGQTDSFEVEAVSLGHLKRLIVGHDATGAGFGWFLEKVVISEPGAKRGESYTFYCNKWLDEGEDDGKIVRELRIQDTYMDDIIEKRNWEYEKWKFENRNQIMFFCLSTGKALRIKSDGSVDGLGEGKDSSSVFSVHKRKPMVHVFSSHMNTSFHLAIENGRLLGHGRGGSLSEFRVRVQSDQSVVLEAVKNPLQFVSILDTGRPGDVRGILDNDPTQCFNVYCKGMFRHRGIIMLRTSPSQSVSVDHDKSVFGTGRCNRAAHFRVHKVAGGIRMFESMIYPGHFLRMKDGKIDCAGGKEETAHFLVAKHKDKGYIVLQSSEQRGLYVGLTTEGKVHPTVDTGVKNIWLYPEVVEFGVPKQSSPGRLPPVREVRAGARDEPPQSVSPRQEIEDGDWKIIVSTSESLENGEVVLIAYGDQGSSGPVKLLAPQQNGPLFQTGSNDEFKANLLKCGKLYKIRFELVTLNPTKTTSWKVREVKMQDLNSKEQLRFQFNRWLSRQNEDGEIMRELPVSRPGAEVLPVLIYIVEVTTGREPNAATDADVHLTVFGERGDTGKRALRLSTMSKKFRQGQTDKFEVEAVHLGKLAKVQIGHNATVAGDGWYLEKVVIREREGASDEYIFPCDRWLDASLEDRRIERTLYVKEPAPTRIIRAMRRESSEYASMVVAAAIEAASRNLLESGDLDGNDTDVSEVGDNEIVQLECKDNDIPDNETVLSEMSDHGIVELEPNGPEIDDDTDHSSIYEGEENGGILTEHAQNDSCSNDADVDVNAEAIEEKYTLGDWKVWTTTGNRDGADTKDEVVLFVYGSSGHVGPINLGKGHNGNFKRGQTDEFDIHVQRGSKLGQLYKIRIGLYETSPDNGWFLEKVRMKDMTSEEDYSFSVNRWMSRLEEDHDVWRELPLSSANQRPLPVYVYQVEVFTGSVEGSQTDASVYITVHGERGDTGKRKLVTSKSNKQPFQKGKIDVFDLEAVSLGELERVIIGHENYRAGRGWYLEKVVIKESSGVDSRQFYFPCDRWLDSGKEDKKTERELVVSDPPSISQGEYKLLVKTATDSKPAEGGKVFIALYGSNGNSDDIPLYAPSAKAKLFESGNMDEFEVAVGHIGELQKIRISRDDNENWKGWHLQEVILQDKHTKEEHVFAFNRWLGRGLEDSDLAREAAVVKAGKPRLPVCHYQLIVCTGNHWAGETDAEIYMTLYGSQGDTGRRVLYRSPTEGPAFRRGQKDTFTFEAVSLGELRNLVIGHASKGHGAGWFLDKVVVVEKGSKSQVQYVFPCYQWLDDGEGDGAIERSLRVVDTADTRKKSPVKKNSKSVGVYDVLIKTSDNTDAGTKAKVLLTLCGRNGDSKPQVLPDPRTELLQPGKELKFQVSVGNIGELTKIRLHHESTSSSPAWRCDFVKVSSIATGEELVFFVDGWLAEDKEDGQVLKEIAVSGRPDKMPLPALQYVVMVQTSKDRGEGAPGAHVSIGLYGSDGSTGLHSLARSLSGPASAMFKDGHLDVFVIPSVSIGKLQQIQLYFTKRGKETSWTVDRVTVMDGVAALVESVFNCRCTMKDEGEGCLRSFSLSETQISSGVSEDVIFRMRDRSEPVSRGKWTTLIYTGGQSDAGTKDKVRMVIYGTTGQTEPKHLNKDGAFSAGSCVKTQLNVGSIGKLFKVRIFFDDRLENSAWFLQKLKMKDVNTGEEFNLDYNDWVRSTRDNPGGSIELPLIRPDLSPLPDVNYQLVVRTGDHLVAETDAEITCTVIGQWGDTGERSLATSKRNKKPFQRGQTDEFEIEGLDVGVISKLLIGHNEIGRGCGWHCDQVTIRAVTKSNQKLGETVFLCNRWMDSGCDDRQLVRGLSPLVHLEPAIEFPAAQRSKSKGIWTCFVTMATEEEMEIAPSNVNQPLKLVVYGSNNVEGPVHLSDGKSQPLHLGQTHKFTGIKLNSIGDIQKIRVILGEELETKPVWTIKKIVLEDADTGETHKFSFEHWVGEVDSDTSKELPLIQSGQSFPHLQDYYVTVYTSDLKNAGTSSEIFVNLHGKINDCGHRHLRKNTKHSTKFKDNQVDTFIINAVYLGELQRVSVSKGPGRPWHLDKICVKEGQFSNTEYIFEANRWIGSDTSQSVEVDETLTLSSTRPSSVALPPESAEDLPVSRGQWKVETVTGRGGTRGDVSDLVVVLCGERGESSYLPLQSSNSKPFQAGQTDICHVKLAEDLGEMFKARIGYQNNSKEKAWNLQKIIFEDEDTRDCFSYDLDSWVTIDNNQDGWREFPVVWPAVHILPVLKYQVSVYYGDVLNASADFCLQLEIVGEKGSTGQRQLKHALNNKHSFQRNQVDEFQVEAVSVLDIERITVGHLFRTKGQGLYLKRVVIKEASDAKKEFVFVCNRWLDHGEDDHAIERTLHPHTGPIPDDVAPIRTTTEAKKPIPPPPPKGDPWSVLTTTGRNPGEGTKSALSLVLYGDKGSSEPVIIGDEIGFNFEPGAEDKFDVRVNRDPGSVYKMRLTFEGTNDTFRGWYADLGTAPSWHADEIVVQNMVTMRKYEFECRQWVRLTDYADFPLEIPVLLSDRNRMLQVYKYHVEVFTGDVKYAGTDANVFIKIYGERGDTGWRHLHGSYTSSNKFEQGQRDLFEIEAVDLGMLKKVKVTHDGYGVGSGWFLDKVVIQVPQEGEDKYVFNCGRWLDEGQDDKVLERVLSLSEVIKEDAPKSGDWQVLVTTGEEEDSATDARVYLKVYGDRGESAERRLEGYFDCGRTDRVDMWLDPEEIGHIKKIRLRHDDSGMAAGWRVQKVVMINRLSEEHLDFPINRWLSFTEKYGDITVEVPARYPGRTPEAVYKYIVQTTTASDWGAGTDANVYITIVGSNGDSGKRFLKNSLEEKNKFETGGTDTFYVEAVDLGKLQKVFVGHDGRGAGSGWKLDSVTIKISNLEVFFFPYGKWIDEDKDDRVTEAEIPVGDIQRE